MRAANLSIMLKRRLNRELQRRTITDAGGKTVLLQVLLIQTGHRAIGHFNIVSHAIQPDALIAHDRNQLRVLKAAAQETFLQPLGTSMVLEVAPNAEAVAREVCQLSLDRRSRQ